MNDIKEKYFAKIKGEIVNGLFIVFERCMSFNLKSFRLQNGKKTFAPIIECKQPLDVLKFQYIVNQS